MIFKKSQVALEFLMTYGWAILVVLVAIGALAYFGILSPDKFLPSKCTLSAGIACLDHRTTPAEIQVVVQNSLGYDIDTMIVVSASDTSTCGPSSSPASLTNGAKGTYTLTCTPALIGSKYSGSLNVSYRTIETGLSHKNQGNIVSKVE